jgi:hypothetical protein
MRKILIAVTSLSMLGILGIATSPAAVAKAHKSSGSTIHDGPSGSAIYDSTVQPFPGNLVSESFEATATAQFGNQISFGGTSRVLSSVVVQLSSWGCQQGSWSLPGPAAFPPAPANGTIVQGAPSSNSTDAAGWATFTDQLTTTGGVGAVTFVTTSPSGNVSVNSTGGVTTTGVFPGTGEYTVKGTDSDTGSGTGVWSYTLVVGQNPCLTTPGSTFNEPITLNIYNVGPAYAHGPSTPGSLVASMTKTFAIPYRPSEDDVHCTGPYNAGGSAGGWYDSALASCFHGMETNVQFDFGHVTLPDNIIYGIAYNTSDWGAQPYGYTPACHNATDSYVSPATYDDCGYDALNVGLTNEPTAPLVGTDTYQGTVYQNIVNSGYQNNYCDSGAAGINVFRIDEPANYPTGNGTTSGCWSVNGNGTSPWYVPTVQFSAVQSPHAVITSYNRASTVAGTPFSFTVTTTGVPVPTITERGKLPKGLTFKNNGDGTATIAGTALTTNRNKTYRFTLRAMNLPTGGRNRQTFFLTLTGGT